MGDVFGDLKQQKGFGKMRRFLWTTLLLAILTALPIKAQEPASRDIYFGGLIYDDGLSLQSGYGGPVIQNVIAGGDLYTWFVLEMGLSPDVGGRDSLFKAGAGGLEASLLFGDQAFFYGLLVNALKLDWLNIQNGGSPDWSSYLSNMVGVQVGGNIKNRIGWSARVNYSFDYEKSLFPDGPAAGIYLFLRR